MNWRSETTAPAWWKGMITRLGGSAGPVERTLGGASPSTPETSQVPSTWRARVPKEIPFEVSGVDCPGPVASRAARRSAVISRASISV